MSVEFIDTNILIYGQEPAAGAKHNRAVELLARLFEDGCGALSIQVLSEFYSVATRKLAMTSEEAEEVIRDLGVWTIHRPGHADILQAIGLQHKFQVSWWDALVLNSATELDCSVLWSEDFSDGRKYGSVTARNPFV
jgi:predicted nucleic acid-binding protein